MDDTLIVSKASIPQEKEIKRILTVYEEAVGQKVNFQKCNFFFLNSPPHWCGRIARIFGCEIGDFPSNYNGMPLFKGPFQESMWNSVIEHFQRKLAGWKSVLLNQAGKAQLGKATLQSIPMYLTSLFRISLLVTQKIEKI